MGDRCWFSISRCGGGLRPFHCSRGPLLIFEDDPFVECPKWRHWLGMGISCIIINVSFGAETIGWCVYDLEVLVVSLSMFIYLYIYIYICIFDVSVCVAKTFRTYLWVVYWHVPMSLNTVISNKTIQIQSMHSVLHRFYIVWELWALRLVESLIKMMHTTYICCWF